MEESDKLSNHCTACKAAQIQQEVAQSQRDADNEPPATAQPKLQKADQN